MTLPTIAIAGIRGIPANYGGFETFAENLAPRLAARGYRVRVYGRTRYVPRSLTDYRGVEIVSLPTIPQKHLDTLFHTWLCTLHLLAQRADIVLIPNVGNALVCWIPRMRGSRVVLNVDGVEWRRAKWGRGARAFLRLSERVGVRVATRIVTDADVVRDYYRRRHGIEPAMIPYGAQVRRRRDTRALAEFGLEPEGYVLYVSRLEPENNAAAVVEAYRRVKTDLPLVVVGDAPYAADYIEKVRAAADKRVRFLGAVYGSGYETLQQHAYCYIQATQVGGTHPALVEAMGFGNCVLALDVPSNAEVLGDAGLLFSDTEGLVDRLQWTVDHPDRLPELRRGAQKRVAERYDWERVTDAYEILFRSIHPVGIHP